jgi:predicted MFS family arabinose efflux permease
MSLRVQHIPRLATGDLRSEMRAGLAFVWKQEALRSLTLLAFASTFLGLQLTTFLAVFAKDIFHTGAKGNSTLIAISGAGAVTGALIMAGLGNTRHKGRKALIMQICFGASIIAFTLTPSVWLAYPFLFIASVFMMCVFALITSLVQLLVSDEMRGRVMSIFMVAFRGGMPLGALATGSLAKYLPLNRILLVEGLLLALLAVTYLMSKSEVKEH